MGFQYLERRKGNYIIPKVSWNDLFLFYLKHFSFFVEKKRGIEKWWSNLSLSHLINQLLRDHKQSYSTSTFQIKEGQQEKGKPMLEEQKDQNRYLYICELSLHSSHSDPKGIFEISNVRLLKSIANPSKSFRQILWQTLDWS